MRKFTESLNTITKVEGKSITYFDLFPLLKGLEKERPGIKERIWKWLCDEWDVAFKPYNGRILNLNLYYYGVGDEYPLKRHAGEANHEESVNYSKKIHPDAFLGYMSDGKMPLSGDPKMQDLRIDLNLIWQVYEDQIVDAESFPVITRW